MSVPGQRESHPPSRDSASVSPAGESSAGVSSASVSPAGHVAEQEATIAALRGELAASQQREQVLRDRQNRCHLALEGKDMGLWNWDVSRDLIEFTPDWSNFLGVPQDQAASNFELLDRTVHSEDRDYLKRAITGHLDGNTPHYEVEHRRRDRDGRWRWIIDRGRVVCRDEGGNPRWVVGTHIDVTHYRHAETAMWEAESQFRAAFQNAALGLAMGGARESGLIIESNEALERMLGFPSGGLIGKTFGELLNPDDAPSFQELWNKLMRGDASSFRSELCCVQKSGANVRVRLTLSLVRDTRRNPLYALAIVEDVTERYRAERRTRAEQELLRELLGLQDRERQLIAYEIHDGLVQYLVGSKMFLEGAAHRLDCPTADAAVDLTPALQGLAMAIDEGRRLISDLRPMIIDERGIVEALNYLVEEQQADGTLDIDFCHDVQFDRLAQLLEGTLYRIVQESLTNVRRHAQTDRVAISLTQNGDHMELVIRDEGAGFDLAAVPPERFGLRGIQERARLFGGHAVVRTQLGAGTKVHVVLPLSLPTDDPCADSEDDA